MPSRPFRLLIALCFALSLNVYFSIVKCFSGSIFLKSTSTPEDLAIEWQDNVFPYRNQTPWDVSTDYPYPRTLEYEVTEGTWLRLDVHPKTGDIVFDMLGDLYCIPGSETFYDDGTFAKARPILTGIPYDSDPRFSPEGDRLVFRSDAELGNDNIWILYWKGCEQMDVRPTDSDSNAELTEALSQASYEKDLIELTEALSQASYEKDLIVERVTETSHRRRNRLIREGRLGARRVTNETYRYVTGARFHPSGSKVIASKWYTGRITIAASEGWEYDVPDLSTEQTPGSIQVGRGKRIIGRTLPAGKTIGDYANQQIGPEQFIWHTEDSIIFAKNAVDDYVTSEKDVHKGAFAIYTKNLTTGVEETLVDAFPGGASRPELSRDGRTLAFVRHVRKREVLVLKDLLSGTLHYVWDGLSYDFSGSAPGPSGPYPCFAFSPSDDAIIIWATGQIYRVPLTLNRFGEKVAGGTPTPIPFKAQVRLQLADTLRGGIDLLKLETRDTHRIHALKELAIDDTGDRAVFQAAGTTVVQNFGHRNFTAVPVLIPGAPYYSPSFVPRANHLILHSRWSDVDFTSFELADMDTGVALELTGIPMGRYFAPVMSDNAGAARSIAFIKTGGDLLTGNVVATARPGIYVGQIRLPVEGSQSEDVPVTNVHFVASQVDAKDKNTVLRFVGESILVVQQATKVFTIDLIADPNSYSQLQQTTLLTGRMSNEISVHPSPLSKAAAIDMGQIAFLEYQHIYLVNGKNVRSGEMLWAKPGNATQGLARLSVDGGHSIAWSRDGRKVFWLSGPTIFSLEVSKLNQCASSVEQDPIYFGISCVQAILDRQEVFVDHSTDIARLRREARIMNQSNTENADVVVIRNATILTMESGQRDLDLIEEGVMVVQAGVISQVGTVEEVSVPTGATVIDAHGGYLIPGFIDAHAHWSGYTVQYPAKSWEMQTFLSYGVTTMHNPSSDTVDTFVERSRLESGQFIGPRILTTGTVLFAGSWVGLHEEIVDECQAKNALNRIKAEGGPVTLSYKNYQLPSRASRQRLFKVARNLSMLCVPEGGANFDWDLTYIIDGMTSVEHNLPFSSLYEDVLKLFAWSGTGYTPTHLVNYGGPPGEQYVWANHDVPNDVKLSRFHSHESLYSHTESIARPDYSYVLFNISQSATKMARMGLNLHIGAHGEHPMGHNYHAEMWFTQQGGSSNYEVLKAATFSAAKTLGLFSSIGSLTAGKLADFLLYPPGIDLLNGGVEYTKDLMIVARGGRLWNASSMIEVWPVKGKQQTMPPFNAD
ncbi:hypothetical protein K435DRAFT_959464 [Dendrothele bispora CBS 962.96]|uniref:Amidohydrolase-related domain-containing protein n=1 Tax=Dendrothele bispora (strain CBS 962.96) TaxID=1314807 RepID=A0A4S8MXQ0_DENBC|nr:hypothetical protein K435DRAFT_959464 [Dendrothele bispora CBS 962.96]